MLPGLWAWVHALDRELYHVTDTGIVVVEGHRSSVDISSMNL
jgi:hypothetical protein